MSTQTEEFDVIVIGAGPAGENAADHAIRNSGRTVALVEAELVGGECSYYACMPSKALLRPLDVIAAANALGGVGGPVRLDREALLARRDEWVANYNDEGQVSWAEGAGITVIRGRGRLSGERTVEVADASGGVRRLRAREAVVVATGSTPTIPDVYAELAPWTSRDATGVVEVPDRIAIIGGGVVACEAARWLAALGATVTMLVRGDRLLPRAEPFAGDAVAQSLRSNGIEVRLNATVDAARRERPEQTGLGIPHGGVVTLDTDRGELEVEEVLVATGRRPATAGLGLDEHHGDWLHLVGDASGEAPLTHWGKYRARQVGALIAARAEGRPAPSFAEPVEAPVPQVVFTDPQVAWTGQTRADAEHAGRSVITLDADLTSAAGAALLRDDATGHARLVADAETGQLLGATFVGPEVAELLHSATVAIVGGLTLTQLADAVPSYPTASEVWLRLLDQPPGRQR
ncbi:pyridine nucleotide-disulfide oxidoreductase [Enemella dayhoffiae]|uniref:Pyridine nucleotide-disulfide oxidoreductase n=1 Tax=Enemella dayhoffiae TaxID=2016507 RepID=A0A255HA34_9ACTN|nr:NAD(P)/FAD-dependent oxidoreductase [Enemella dayhoffiae]OYO24425.1 pyridine nucleotide-disulfide oxidoreductase [Enemella dayhoffiae]